MPSMSCSMPSPAAALLLAAVPCAVLLLRARWRLHSRQRGNDGVQRPSFARTKRTVVCADSVAWLRALPRLPVEYSVVTSLPDVCELQLALRAYEDWFVEVVATLLDKLAVHQLAIFYQTGVRIRDQRASWARPSLPLSDASRAQTAGSAPTAPG